MARSTMAQAGTIPTTVTRMAGTVALSSFRILQTGLTDLIGRMPSPPRPTNLPASAPASRPSIPSASRRTGGGGGGGRRR